jgi:hypothetical protein
MKRIYSFAIGLAMLVAPTATAGLAAADPGVRQMDYQQAADIVVQRGLSQRGVPFSWAGGGVTGPSRGKGTGAMTVGFDAPGSSCRVRPARYTGPDRRSCRSKHNAAT